MPNRIRPRCPDCGKAMAPLYAKNRRDGFTRLQEVFGCRTDGRVARGRLKTRLL